MVCIQQTTSLTSHVYFYKVRNNMAEKSFFSKLFGRRVPAHEDLNTTVPAPELKQELRRFDRLAEQLEGRRYDLGAIQDKALRLGFYTTDPAVAEYAAEYCRIMDRPIVLIELGGSSDVQTVKQQLDTAARATVIVKVDPSLPEDLIEQGGRRKTTRYSDSSVGSRLRDCSDQIRARVSSDCATIILLPNENYNLDTKELMMNLTRIIPRPARPE